MKMCLDCKNFSLKEVPAMARHGFGWCPHQAANLPGGANSRAVTVSAKRGACEKFESAPAATVSKRIEWIEAQK